MSGVVTSPIICKYDYVSNVPTESFRRRCCLSSRRSLLRVRTLARAAQSSHTEDMGLSLQAISVMTHVEVRGGDEVLILLL